MLFNPALARAALLVLCLSACAASDPDLPDSGGAGASQDAGSRSADVLIGHHALSTADATMAASAFERALSGDPGDPDLRRQAFTAGILSGHADAATTVALARSLAQAPPRDPAALLVLADADIKAGNWDGAAAEFARLPTDGAEQVLQALLTAWGQQGQGETDAAIATLRPYVEGTRYRGIFALNAAMIADLASRPAEAARLYRLSLVEYGALNLRLGTLVASSQARNGQPAEARGTIHAMVQASPDLAIAEPALQQSTSSMKVASAADGVAEAYLAIAAALQQQDVPDFAMVLLRLAIALRPDFTSARLLLADMMAAHGQADGALLVLAPVPPSDPLAAVVQLRQAKFAETQGNDAAAEAALRSLADAYPSQAKPLAMLGELQSGKGRFAQAAATLGVAIARLAKPSPSDWPLYYQQGVAYDQAHDWPRAEADFLQALNLAPDQPVVLNYLGYSWTEQGRNLGRARQLIERAVELRPNDGSIVDSFGWALLQGGDKAGAVKVLERAVELEPEDATINAHLGDAYQAAGRRREAQVQWRRALILNPAPGDAARLQAKLSGADRAGLPQAAERRVE